MTTELEVWSNRNSSYRNSNDRNSSYNDHAELLLDECPWLDPTGHFNETHDPAGYLCTGDGGDDDDDNDDTDMRSRVSGLAAHWSEPE